MRAYRLSAGSVATLAVFTSCVIWPETAIGLLTPISRRIALGRVQGLAPLFGNVWLHSRAMEWTFAVILTVLVPIAFFCVVPLLVAVTGGRVGRHFGPRQPAMGAGLGETWNTTPHRMLG